MHTKLNSFFLTLHFDMSLLAEEVMDARSSTVFPANAAVTSLATPDASLLELVDRLGLSKYARVFIDQEVSILVIEKNFWAHF